MAPRLSDPEDLHASVSPNSVGDQPTKQDSLGFKPYVVAVAAFLDHPETLAPLTISVEGAWGSGKSSFMLQLEEQIKSKGGITIWFNAWRHDRNEELWADFALHFTDKLAGTLPLWKKWLLHLKLGYLRFNLKKGWFPLAKFVLLTSLAIFLSVRISNFWLTHSSALKQQLSSPKWDEILYGLLLSTGGMGVYILLGFGFFRKVSEILGNPLKTRLTDYLRDPKYETRAAFIETFHADFGRLVATYAEKRKIFVFIDDLDRCEVPKAAELMQALNLLISESAPIFYVLGLDREKVAAGLAAKYEKLLPYLSTKSAGTTNTSVIGREFGYSFLEKFIQIPFLVPQPSNRDLDKLLDSLGSGIAKQNIGGIEPPREVDAGLLVELSSDSESVRDVVKMVAPSFEYNPRRLKQFINLFRLRALLASQTGLFGHAESGKESQPLTFDQLGKLVAIMLRWPLLLNDLEADPSMLYRLQTVAWAERDTNIPDPALHYWIDKSNLMELIAFPSKDGSPVEETEKRRYGLRHLDTERFLQIAPPVPGRGLGERPIERPPYEEATPKTNLGPLPYSNSPETQSFQPETAFPSKSSIRAERSGPVESRPHSTPQVKKKK